MPRDDQAMRSAMNPSLPLSLFSVRISRGFHASNAAAETRLEFLIRDSCSRPFGSRARNLPIDSEQDCLNGWRWLR